MGGSHDYITVDVKFLGSNSNVLWRWLSNLVSIRSRLVLQSLNYFFSSSWWAHFSYYTLFSIQVKFNLKTWNIEHNIFYFSQDEKYGLKYCCGIGSKTLFFWQSFLTSSNATKPVELKFKCYRFPQFKRRKWVRIIVRTITVNKLDKAKRRWCFHPFPCGAMRTCLQPHLAVHSLSPWFIV